MKSLNTNHLGKTYLENFSKITVKDLLQQIEEELRKKMLDIKLGGINLLSSKTNYGGERKWFECPSCKKRVFKLYDINGFFHCNKCSGLSYKKQRYKGMIELKY